MLHCADVQYSAGCVEVGVVTGAGMAAATAESVFGGGAVAEGQIIIKYFQHVPRPQYQAATTCAAQEGGCSGWQWKGEQGRRAGLLTGASTASSGTRSNSTRSSRACCSVYMRLMALYTRRSITHSRQSVVARTEAVQGAEYSGASSPKPLLCEIARGWERGVHEGGGGGTTAFSRTYVQRALLPAGSCLRPRALSLNGCRRASEFNKHTCMGDSTACAGSSWACRQTERARRHCCCKGNPPGVQINCDAAAPPTDRMHPPHSTCGSAQP